MSSEFDTRQSALGIQDDNPWPGLATFTEDQAGLFYGRTEEIRDLTRRTERNALTVLFGQSGLGKSSLLQAGVFPRLRAAGYWPIYVRLDHGPGAPAPAEQVKALVQADTQRAGKWTKSGAAVPGESLWEFFHHRDDRLVSAAGKAIVPVLVFDQFEELFTLGAGVGGGPERARAVAFMSELAELVENRAPEKLVARLEESSAEMEVFDFSRTDYRVVITLREDYLPHLETLKTIMPALMENRMRLARMTGTQALEAVVKPGGALVTEDVARAIVEFVAGAKGGSIERLAELDVEPPLLSVICRELNERRRKLGQAQITVDLVSGNRREILNDFYERSVADLPEGMRTFVEDKLLTKSGFRDNLAVETALQEPGVTPALIDTLVARRLLRIEDRIGVQRVELTHDVLAEVVRAARDERQQRLLLAKTEERERITRRRMWLARTIAAGLLVGLAGVSWIAWRAIRAERATDALRAQEVVLREREAKLRQEAETRRLEDARRWSRADTVTAGRLIGEGDTQEALALLVHAARNDPENAVVAPRLLMTLSSRSFAQLEGAPIRLSTEIDPAANRWDALSPDERWMTFTGRDGALHIADFPSGTEVAKISPERGITAFGAWGKAITGLDLSTRKAVEYYDPATGNRLSRIELKDPWTGGLPSVDGMTLILNADNVFTVWDGRTGKLRARFEHASRAEWFEATDNCERMAVLTNDQKTLTIDEVVAPGEPARRHQITVAFPITAFRFNHEGRTIAIASASGFQLFEVATGKSIGPWMPHDGIRSSRTVLTFSPDDATIVSLGANRTAKVWDSRTGKLLLPPLAHGGSVLGIPAFVAEARRMLTRAGDGYYRLWDLRTGRLVMEPFKPVEGGYVHVTNDGQHLLEFVPDGRINRYRVEPRSAAPISVSFGENALGRAWHDAFPAVVQTARREQVDLFDVTKGKLTEKIAYPEPITTAFSSADNRTLVVRTAAGTRQVWRLEQAGLKATPLAEISQSPNLYTRVSADGRWLLCFENGAREMRVWDLQTGKPAGPPLKYNGVLNNFSGNGTFSPDGRLVAAATGSGEAKIWEIATGRLVQDLKPLSGLVRRVDFHPDGKSVATTENSRGSRFWDLASGAPTTPYLALRRSAGNHNSGGFSADGRRFINYSPGGGAVSVWDGKTGAKVGTELEHATILRIPSFSADASKLAVPAEDGTVRLWDVETSQLLAEPLKHPDLVTSVSFSPDGRFLLTRCNDRKTRIWPVPPPMGVRAPEWLLQLATVYAGARVDQNGALTAANEEKLGWEKLRAQIRSLPDDSPYAVWGKWIVADADRRPLAPGFEFTYAEAEAQGLIAAPVAPPSEEVATPAASLIK